MFKDPQRAPIRTPDDPRINFRLEMADMADTMKSPGKRYKKLTKDTATALAHTCRGFVDLLSTTQDYVLLRIFTTDFLKKMFGKLRQGDKGLAGPTLLPCSKFWKNYISTKQNYY